MRNRADNDRFIAATEVATAMVKGRPLPERSDTLDVPHKGIIATTATACEEDHKRVAGGWPQQI